MNFNTFIELLTLRLNMIALEFPNATGSQCKEVLEMEIKALREVAKQFGFEEGK